MIVYMVFIKHGFGGIKYFQKKENAEAFANSVGEKVEMEYATAQEWHALTYDDPITDNDW